MSSFVQQALALRPFGRHILDSRASRITCSQQQTPVAHKCMRSALSGTSIVVPAPLAAEERVQCTISASWAKPT